MRSLFFKIFISFWISTILAAILVGLTAELRRSAQVFEGWRNMFSGVVSVNANTFAQAYENQGCSGLRQQERSPRLFAGRILSGPLAAPKYARDPDR